MVSWRECLRLQTKRELTEDHKKQKMMRLMQVANCIKTSLVGLPCCFIPFCNIVILAQTAKLFIITSALVFVARLYSGISALISATLRFYQM